MEEVKYLFEIVKCFLENRECDFNENIDEAKLYSLAKTHKLSNFLQKWALKYAKSSEVKKKVLVDYNRQIIKDTNENIELEKILNAFEEAGIKTLVVKGVIMKEVYPQDYMRQMCDIDIMIHGEDFKKASKIMKNFGYSEFYNHEKHLVFEKAPFIIVEMHRKLIPGADISCEYFNDEIWNLSVNYKNYKNIYRMDLTDSYIFCIIHLIRHFKYAGIHNRDILDIYLYYKKYKNEFDYEKLNKKLKEFEADIFEENIRKIAYKWFGGESINDFDDIERFILKGESINNQINFSISDKGGKSNYLLKLFFPSLKIMREKYPILRKFPIFLPFTWVIRLINDIFSKETTVKKRLGTIKLIQEANLNDAQDIKKIYQDLGVIRRED